jgi:hypothetical protein
MFQASTVFRMLVPVLASGKVDLVAWYRIHDLPNTQEIIGDVNNRYLGLLDLRNSPKPALYALRFFVDLFGAGIVSADKRVRLETKIATDAEVRSFYRPDKALIVVAWLKVVSPHQSNQNGSDLRTETFKVSLPARYKRGVVYDEIGRQRGSVQVEANSASVTIAGGETRVLVFR